MKKIAVLIIGLFSYVSSFSQTEGMSYQAVILNPTAVEIPGVNLQQSILQNTMVALQFSILDANGDLSYQESHSTRTDAYGMINLIIGSGTASFNLFSDILWDGNPKKLKVEIDFSNSGSNFVFLNEQNLTYIPQPVSARSAEVLDGILATIETNTSTISDLNTLADGKIYLGNAANQATEVSITGDVTMNNAGVSSIGLDKVTTHKIKDANVTNTKLDKSNIPLSGFATAENDVNLGANKLTNLANPTNAQDAATKNYIDAIEDAAKQAIETNAGMIAVNTATIGAKTSITDIVDDLTTGGTTVPLSAEQGKILKGLIESYLASITNAVSKTGDQTIAGAKTFSETIVGNINGNATTVTNGVYTSSSVTALNDVTSVGSGAIITAAERTKLTDIKASTGLEKITEGDNTGFAIVGRESTKYGPLGNGAIDMSTSYSNSETVGATGDNSFAIGGDTEASGYFSLAGGYASKAIGANSIAFGYTATAEGNVSVSLGGNTKAKGGNSVAMGMSSNAIGNFSVAIGNDTKAIGNYSVAIGNVTKAINENSVALGAFNVGNSTEALFELGNGISANDRSNALTILKNGTITAPDFTDALITAAGDQALITKKYADANYAAKNYTVNNFYAELGGYVIEVNSTGTHGLVVAMQDQGSSNWFEANNLLSDPSKHDVDGGEFKDWRIPTLRELNLLHDIFRNGGNGASLTRRVYWSSTELNDTKAYAQLFNYGDDYPDPKTKANQVRAVRAF